MFLCIWESKSSAPRRLNYLPDSLIGSIFLTIAGKHQFIRNRHRGLSDKMISNFLLSKWLSCTFPERFILCKFWLVFVKNTFLHLLVSSLFALFLAVNYCNFLSVYCIQIVISGSIDCMVSLTPLSLQSFKRKEYWMIYRGPGLSLCHMNWLLPHHLPLSRQ